MSLPRPTLTGTPVLETGRLRLRAPMPGDFEALATFYASDRSAFTGGPKSRDEAWRTFCVFTGHWVLRGFGMFVLTLRDTGDPVGLAGPWFPEGWPEPEIGWRVFDGAEGRGLAFEAAMAARAYAYDVLGWTTAISVIDTANARSEALARRLGCVPEAPYVREGWGETRIWRHPGPENLAEGGMEAYA